MRTIFFLLLLGMSVHAAAQTTLTLGNALYFSQSGNASDGLPNARLIENWGIRYASPNTHHVFSSYTSFLIGYLPSGEDWGSGNLFVQGNTGIGTTSPSTRLDVAEAGGGSGNATALRLRSGNNDNYFGNSQILFSYAGTTGYSHAIKSRHNSGAITENALDFYVWQPGDAAEATGSNLTMTLDGGNVGIGLLSPDARLHVNGKVKIQGNNDLELGGGITKEGSAGKIAYQHFSDALDIVGAGTTSTNRKIKFWNEGGATFTGAVGIGTSSPDQKLTVNGTIHSKEVKVDLSVPAPDYVFEKAYKLTSLDSIKTYIDQHKHLPEVPSAKDMEANGVNLGEMNMLLLKKMEEMTLYMIEQQRQIEELKEFVKNR